MSKFVRLSSIAELTVGFVGTMAKHYEKDGIPFLRSLNIKPFKIVGNDMKYVSDEFSNSISKSILHEGDVIIVRTGIPGTCCVVPTDYDGCNCSDVVIVHPKTELVNPHYLAAYINVWGQRQIQNNKVGAIQQHFNVRSAEEMLVFLPDITEQKKIANVIIALNRKIDNNDSICTELEAIAKTLYDYWFTQFDFPDENGKPYRSSGGKMVWNEQLKREIPKGWGVKNIENCCDIVDCLHSQKPERVYEDDAYYLLQLDNLVGLGLIDLCEKYYVAKEMYDLWTSKIEVTDGDLVVTNAGRIGAVSRIPSYVFAGIGRNMTVIRPRTIPAFFLYYFFKSPDFVVQMRANTDSGAFFGSLNVRGIKRLLLTTPPETSDILSRFNAMVEPMRRRIESIQQENEEFTKLRDWLLPMLMNGQATVE